MKLTDIMMETKFAPSRKQALRLINQGAVRVHFGDDMYKVLGDSDVMEGIEFILNVGKRKWAKIKWD